MGAGPKVHYQRVGSPGILRYIKARVPPTFILENVQGLVTTHKAMFEQILNEIRKIKRQTMNSLDHSLPQHRRCIFIVGIDTDRDNGSFKWPEKIHMTPLDKILDPPEKPMVAKHLTRTPPKTQVKANENLKEVKRRIRQQKLNPIQAPLHLPC